MVPRWRRITFTRWDDVYGNGLWVMNADGTEAAPTLGHGPDELREYPIWSPNSTRIAFTQTHRNAALRSIFTMSADGSDLLELVSFGNPPFTTGHVVDWSDDGWWILLTRPPYVTGEGDSYRPDIYLVRLDGLTVRVTSDGRSHSPAYLRR